MALILKQKVFEGEFFDQPSGQRVGLLYRKATTKEKGLFNSALARLLIKLQNGKSTEDYSDEQFDLLKEWGEKMLVGMRDNDFYLNEDDEQPISSDKDSENYYDGWKAVIEEEMPELLVAIAGVVFGEVRHLPQTEKKKLSPGT